MNANEAPAPDPFYNSDTDTDSSDWSDEDKLYEKCRNNDSIFSDGENDEDFKLRGDESTDIDTDIDSDVSHEEAMIVEIVNETDKKDLAEHTDEYNKTDKVEKPATPNYSENAENVPPHSDNVIDNVIDNVESQPKKGMYPNRSLLDDSILQ